MTQTTNIYFLSSVLVGPCRPAPVYCPSPPGWYGKWQRIWKQFEKLEQLKTTACFKHADLFCLPPVHHIVTDNPYPPPTVSGIYTVAISVISDIKSVKDSSCDLFLTNLTKNILWIFSAPSAPVLTAHPIHPGAPPMQPLYQQQPPPPMQPLYAQYQPYQPPPLQPVMQPQPEPAQPAEPVQPAQPEAPEQEAPVQPEVQTPAAEAQPAAALVQGEEETGSVFNQS